MHLRASGARRDRLSAPSQRCRRIPYYRFSNVVDCRGVKMVKDQVRIASLYAGLYRAVFLLGFVVVVAWSFALFSYYLSKKTGIDWFTRSGSVMCLVGAVVTFRQVSVYQTALETALKEGLVSIAREIELGLAP